MSTRDAVAALKRLGLPNYQARVFVALQELGEGTAQEISDISEVPRSQVYGAADDLVERGLVELTESSPKRYRPVSLSAAREQLTNRLERERERAFENLAELRTMPPERADDGAVSTLRGRQPIDDRIAELLESADSSAVFVAPAENSLSETIETTLRERAAEGVAVTVVTAEESGGERFADSPITVIVMGEDNPADFAGRTLMVDDSTVLLAVATDGDTVAEEAMWTAGSSIGRILAQFMQSGIESGKNRHS
ncbi:helix-turn-helix domain-containing protein [Natrinema zhouii]|uniref:TrmB family transcriptional regulator n=1 Tax=Natrinema zhouii TaxID=1710539 RepID=A0A7D6CQI1_9EURY|nr:helix-turn-helix domain-containing protein [Natrinema zhouii]QLK26676.1 helix-turn-helix domain-containing protein [Natrinema zhouii]